MLGLPLSGAPGAGVRYERSACSSVLSDHSPGPRDPWGPCRGSAPLYQKHGRGAQLCVWLEDFLEKLYRDFLGFPRISIPIKP